MKNDQPSALAPVPNSEPTAAARSAGLRYVTDSMRGIARVAKRDHFHYVDADGNAVDDPDTLARIKSLVIPPAWTDVCALKLPGLPREKVLATIGAGEAAAFEAPGSLNSGRQQRRLRPRRAGLVPRFILAKH